MPYNCFVHLKLQIKIFLVFFLGSVFFSLDGFIIRFQSEYLYKPNLVFNFPACMK